MSVEEKQKIKVVFRVFKDGGDVLALFPDEESSPGLCLSYQRVGQHSSAMYYHCMRITRPAKPLEYKSLKTELESIGYELDIKNRRR